MRTDLPGGVETLRAGDWLKQARGVLMARRGPAVSIDGEAGADASLEVQVLLARVLGRPRAWLLAHPEAALAPEQLALLNGLLAQLAEGTPLPYLTGVQEFYGLAFEVTPAVLIPRPETELLVETALEWLRANPSHVRAAEAGIGSGCISVALAKHAPRLRVLATDRSPAALEVARRNSLHHQTGPRILLVLGDLLTAAAGPFDLVCANLPYVPSSIAASLPVARYEPRMALEGGEDGLREIRALLEDSPRWLAPGGLMLLEMQYDQGEAVSAIARNALPGAEVRVLKDFAELPRLAAITRPQE